MGRIVIIEDSSTDMAVFTSILERNGHQVIGANNAEDGVAIVKREQPDLVLMDVILPGMDGFRATRALSRDPETMAIPVILVSTKAMETDRAWGLRQGAKGYITKPPGEANLMRCVGELMGTIGTARAATPRGASA